MNDDKGGAAKETHTFITIHMCDKAVLSSEKKKGPMGFWGWALRLNDARRHLTVTSYINLRQREEKENDGNREGRRRSGTLEC